MGKNKAEGRKVVRKKEGTVFSLNRQRRSTLFAIRVFAYQPRDKGTTFREISREKATQIRERVRHSTIVEPQSLARVSRQFPDERSGSGERNKERARQFRRANVGIPRNDPLCATK